jgi:ATP-binding cassette subfamily C protein
LVGIFVDSLKNTLIEYENNTFRILIILFISWGIQILADFINDITSAKLYTKAEFDIKYHVFTHLKRLPLSYLSENSSAYFTERINNDSQNLTAFAIQSIMSILTTVLSFVYIAIYMFQLNKIMTILIFGLIPVYFVFYNFFKKPLYNANFKFREIQNNFFSKMHHQLEFIKYIKLNGIFDSTDSKVIQSFGPFLSSKMKYIWIKQTYGIIDSIAKYMINSIIFLYSAKEILISNMTLGTFIIINTYSQILMSNISYALNYSESYQSALVSYHRLRNILDAEREIEGKISIGELHNIEISDLSFSYDNERMVLRNLNLKLEKNKIYVLLGKNGSGKSTLYTLLLGLLYNYSGKIKINGVNIKDINMSQFRESKCAVVLQEPELYFDSVRDNLNIESDSRFRNIATQFNFNQFIDTLDEGLDFSIQRNPDNISGGEKQKIAIIGALNKTAELLIMDEPTSALDKKSIWNLYDILKKEKANKIIIIITHHSDFVKIADEVINFDVL